MGCWKLCKHTTIITLNLPKQTLCYINIPYRYWHWPRKHFYTRKTLMNVDKEFSMKHLNLELPFYLIAGGQTLCCITNDLEKFPKSPKIKLLIHYKRILICDRSMRQLWCSDLNSFFCLNYFCGFSALQNNEGGDWFVNLIIGKVRV